jgi:hypothetical protein
MQEPDLVFLCWNQGALLLPLHAGPTKMPRYLFYVCMVHSTRLSSIWTFLSTSSLRFSKTLPSRLAALNCTPLHHHVKSFLPHSIPSLWPWASTLPLGSMSNFGSHPTWQFFSSRPSIPSLGCLIYGSPRAHPCLVPFVPVHPFRFSLVSTTECSFQWATLESYILHVFLNIRISHVFPHYTHPLPLPSSTFLPPHPHTFSHL